MAMNFPPAISIPLFYLVVTVRVLHDFFLGNLYGIFILSILFYKLSGHLFGISPLNFSQMMEWVAGTSQDAKIAITSSLITVVGFLVAYATATSNWRSQLLATMKLDAANECEIFFNECSRLATDCRMFSDALVTGVTKIQKGCQPGEAVFIASYNCQQGLDFLQKRTRLSALNVEAHRLTGRYSNLLVSAPGLKSNLDAAIDALTSITGKVWIFVPFQIVNDPAPVQTFINQVNVTECIALIDAVNSNFEELTFSAGVLRGGLVSEIVGFNFFALFYVYKERKGLSSIVRNSYIRRKSR